MMPVHPKDKTLTYKQMYALQSCTECTDLYIAGGREGGGQLLHKHIAQRKGGSSSSQQST